MRHELKIGREYLKNLVAGRKKAEVRYNDRDYQVNDTLVFNHCGVEDGEYEFVFGVTHVHSGLGLADGYVMLSVVRIQ